MKAQTILLGLCLLLSSMSLNADKRPEHYKGKPAENLEQALGNLAEYNAKLNTLLSEPELSAEQMHEVHQLTYTLENAVKRIDKELDTIEELLETVHLASERADVNTVKDKGQTYLQKSSKLLP